MSAIVRGIAALSFLFLSICGVAQIKPAIDTKSKLLEGQVTIAGTGQTADKTYKTAKIQVCVTADKPSPAPTTCAGGFEALTPVAADGVDVQDKGSFNLKLRQALKKSEWVYVVQTTTATDTKLSSDSVQVAGVTAPAITSSLVPLVNTVTGTAQATVEGLYTEVDVYICHDSNKSSIGTDCSAKPKMAAQLSGVGAAKGPLFASPNSQGTFAANLDTSVPAGESIWLWQKVTTAAGAIFTAASDDSKASASSVRPTITLPLKDGGTAVLGYATKSAGTGDKVKVQLCLKSSPAVTCQPAGYAIDVQTDGSFTIPHTLRQGEIVVVRQQTDNSTTPIAPGYEDSEDVTVGVPDNERIYMDFTAGVLLSQSQNAFSQANLFMNLSVDNAFYRPGFYNPIRETCKDKPQDKSLCTANSHPGLNGFFEARLSAIPVNSTQTSSTTTGAATTSSYDTFLVSRKAAHFEIGTYAPFYFGQTHLPTSALEQAFFVAPVARFGFNTLVDNDSGMNTSTASTAGAGSTSTSTVPAGSTSDSNKVYSFGVAGLRLGTADLKAGSAHTVQYLDIGLGKFSNLNNLYCSTSRTTDNCLSGGNLSATPPNPGTLDPAKEKHYTPYRFLIEGAIDIDGFIIGFSVNKGYIWRGSHRPPDVNQNYGITQAQDDVRFLFGYKLDVNKLLSAVKKTSNF